MKQQDPFEALLHHYRGLLFTLCSRFRHRGLDIDDLIQEATIALWRNRERLLALGNVQQAALTWKVARNAVIDSLRRYEDTDELPEGHDEAAEAFRKLALQFESDTELLGQYFLFCVDNGFSTSRRNAFPPRSSADGASTNSQSLPGTP